MSLVHSNVKGSKALIDMLKYSSITHAYLYIIQPWFSGSTVRSNPDPIV